MKKLYNDKIEKVKKWYEKVKETKWYERVRDESLILATYLVVLIITSYPNYIYNVINHICQRDLIIKLGMSANFAYLKNAIHPLIAWNLLFYFEFGRLCFKKETFSHYLQKAIGKVFLTTATVFFILFVSLIDTWDEDQYIGLVRFFLTTGYIICCLYLKHISLALENDKLTTIKVNTV